MGLKISNNAESTLDGGIAAGATTLDVQVGHGARFPHCALGAGDYFYCTLVNVTGDREVIKVTHHNSDSDTFQVIERSADYIQDTSNTAYAFADGDVIQLRLPAVAILGPSGTTETSFHVDSDNSGPLLKNNAACLDIRTFNDGAYAALHALSLTLEGALAIGGALTGATTGAFSSNVTVTGTLGVTGKLTATTVAGALYIDNFASGATIKAADHEATGLLPQVVNVMYGDGAAPAAAGLPDGTIYIKYV
jgi:hypothetical protein